MIEISVIIPTFNKRIDIELTLSAFNHQSYPPGQFEVIVIDDGSTDGTETLIEGFPANYTLVYHRQENAGRSAARNAGIGLAQGSILIFCDAEAIPDIQFVEQHASHHAKTDNLVVLGSKFDMLSRWSTDIPKAYLDELEQTSGHLECVREAIETARRQGCGTFISRSDIDMDFQSVKKWVFRRAPHNGDHVIERFTSSLDGFSVPWIFFVTVNVSLRRKDLEAVGLFDERFTGWGIEDSELGYRLFKNGFKFVYEERAANYHQMHPVNRDARRRDLAKNFSRFYEKHTAYEILLVWRHARGRLDSCTYSDMVRDYYHLASISDTSPLLKDYLEHCQKAAREYIVGVEFSQITL